MQNIGHEKEVKSYSRVGINIVGFFFALIGLLSVFGVFFEDNEENIITFVFGIFFSIICFKAPLDNHLVIRGGTRNIKFFFRFSFEKRG